MIRPQFRPGLRGRAALFIALGAGALALRCAAPPPPPPAPERSLNTLDRLIAEKKRAGPARPRVSFERCRAGVDVQGLCLDDASKTRTIDIRLALDPEYTRRWRRWQHRLDSTLGCVNRLYSQTGIRWRIAKTTMWDPGKDRHELYKLLHRLQRELPKVDDQLTVGISVWEERKIYRMAGGEIGLSQRASCVVPSWPRVENDCIILAHELGHLIGAKHLPGKSWIMGWAARPFYLPAADPLARVVATYRFHPRNAAAIAAHKTARFTPHGLRPLPRCRERIARIDRCWTDGSVEPRR